MKQVNRDEKNHVRDVSRTEQANVSSTVVVAVAAVVVTVVVVQRPRSRIEQLAKR